MIKIAAPSPRRADSPTGSPARALFAALALAVAALLILACPLLARTAEPGCGDRVVAAMAGAVPDDRSAQAMPRPGAGSTFGPADIGETDDVAGAEFGLPHAAPDAVQTRWVGGGRYASASDVAPGSHLFGSPHRPPRPA